MRKILVITCIFSIFLITGCSLKSNKKIDITDTSFNVDSCDKYFNLLDCILDNDDNVEYTKEDRKELREYIKTMQEEWSGLDENVLDKNCLEGIANFESK